MNLEDISWLKIDTSSSKETEALYSHCSKPLNLNTITRDEYYRISLREDASHNHTRFHIEVYDLSDGKENLLKCLTTSKETEAIPTFLAVLNKLNNNSKTI